MPLQLCSYIVEFIFEMLNPHIPWNVYFINITRALLFLLPVYKWTLYLWSNVTNAFFIFSIEDTLHALQISHLSVSTDTNTVHFFVFNVHYYGWEEAEGSRWTGMCTVHTSLWPLEYIGSLSQRGFESLVRYFRLSSVKQAAVSSSLISSQGTSSGQRHVSPTSTRPAHIQHLIQTHKLHTMHTQIIKLECRRITLSVC